MFSHRRGVKNIQELKRLARGQCDRILTSLVPELADAVANPRKHYPCIVHGGKDGLRAFDDVADTGGVICNTCGSHPDIFSTLMFALGCAFREAVKMVDGYLNSTTVQSYSRPEKGQTVSNQSTTPVKQNRVKFRHWLEEAHPIRTPEAELGQIYLGSRGLAGLATLAGGPPTLWLHPHLPYWFIGKDNKYICMGSRPALIAPIVDVDGNGVGLHRTYLEPDGNGKACIRNPETGKQLPAKKTLSLSDGATKGGAIRLYPANQRLAVAEGVETALAIRLACQDLPVWATVSANGMAQLVVPEWVKEVTICADRDRSCSGEVAAHTLEKRLIKRGIEIRMMIPSTPIPDTSKSVDWLDVLYAEVTA